MYIYLLVFIANIIILYYYYYSKYVLIRYTFNMPVCTPVKPLGILHVYMYLLKI